MHLLREILILHIAPCYRVGAIKYTVLSTRCNTITHYKLYNTLKTVKTLIVYTLCIKC